jgi:hypothetical protein
VIRAEQLFDTTPRQKWTGSRALVPLPREACPECHGPLSERAFGQLSLFVHGGYGAVRTQVTAWCHCGWTLVRSVTETNPRCVA